MPYSSRSTQRKPGAQIKAKNSFFSDFCFSAYLLLFKFSLFCAVVFGSVVPGHKLFRRDIFHADSFSDNTSIWGSYLLDLLIPGLAIVTCGSGTEFAPRYVLVPDFIECLTHSRRSSTLNFTVFGIVIILGGFRAYVT